jgi:hypothetical protein
MAGAWVLAVECGLYGGGREQGGDGDKHGAGQACETSRADGLASAA